MKFQLSVFKTKIASKLFYENNIGKCCILVHSFQAKKNKQEERCLMI